MELVRYHSIEGQYMALVVKTGTKWTHILYMNSPRLTKLSNKEARFFTSFGEASKKHIAMFNASARKAGYHKRKNLAS